MIFSYVSTEKNNTLSRRHNPIRIEVGEEEGVDQRRLAQATLAWAGTKNTQNHNVKSHSNEQSSAS